MSARQTGYKRVNVKFVDRYEKNNVNFQPNLNEFFSGNSLYLKDIFNVFDVRGEHKEMTANLFLLLKH